MRNAVCDGVSGSPPDTVVIDPGALEEDDSRDVAGQRHDDDSDQDVDQDRNQLGGQEPAATDRPGQQVAQSAGVRLSRDRVAGHHQDAQRQQRYEVDGKRGRRHERAVAEHL